MTDILNSLAMSALQSRLSLAARASGFVCPSNGRIKRLRELAVSAGLAADFAAAFVAVFFVAIALTSREMKRVLLVNLSGTRFLVSKFCEGRGSIAERTNFNRTKSCGG